MEISYSQFDDLKTCVDKMYDALRNAHIALGNEWLDCSTVYRALQIGLVGKQTILDIEKTNLNDLDR